MHIDCLNSAVFVRQQAVIGVILKKKFGVKLVLELHLRLLLRNGRLGPKICQKSSRSVSQDTHLHPVEYAEKNGKKMYRIVIMTENKYPVVHIFVKKFL